MLRVRPVEAGDAAGLLALVGEASPWVHTLPKSPAAVERAIERSLASFAESVDVPSDESYLFVLEDAEGGMRGTAAISATAGADGTFFAFRNDVLHQVSRDLGISNNVHALSLSSDLTGHSQLSGFFVQDWSKPGPEAELLSRSRLLFAATAPRRFSDRFFSSLAGITDLDSQSPFWDALGRKFFRMDFLAAERLVEGARNRTLIVELMPHYPVYVPLLPGDAQAALGQVHPEAALPFNILSREGFEPDEYIDIFDGGPILRALRASLKSFTAAVLRDLGAGVPPAAGMPCLVATAREERFRCVLTEVAPLEDAETVLLSEAARRALEVGAGDAVRCVAL
ncbi:MAG: arginine N-succinyltransferase [Betaproteobacteria bacterium]|nr:arginine N-succinyltransferase [Betaproteobacteria bacterium]